MDLTRESAASLVALVKGKKASATEVLEAHLAAIARTNPRLNAFCTLSEDVARAAAKAVDEAVAKGATTGMLAGVPVGIKDVTPTAGIRTTWGSKLYADHVPTEDAEIVRRIRAAGALIVGKTNTPEFAAGANTVNAVFGATRNPWDERMSASGSTGGGASALAARMVPLAQGTDFGGSVRTPAAFCGVVGLRTTPGLIPQHPANLPWHDQSVAGPMARNATDAALFLDAMKGLTPLSPLSREAPWKSALDLVNAAKDMKGKRVGWCPDMVGIGVDPEVAALCREAALGLAAAGATVEEIQCDFSDARDAFIALRGESMLANHWDRLDKLDIIGPNLAGNIRAGLALDIQSIARAERTRALIWHRFRELFAKYDLLLAPTTPVAPFPVEQNFPDEVNGRKLTNYIDWIAPTFCVSIATLPAGSVPAGLTRAGLPVGLQVIGPHYSEPSILIAMKLVEQARPLGLPPIH